MKQYVYRVTKSNEPKLPAGSVMILKENMGKLYVTERFNYETNNFKLGLRARRLGEINWRTKAGKRRQVDAIIGKKANA